MKNVCARKSLGASIVLRPLSFWICIRLLIAGLTGIMFRSQSTTHQIQVIHVDSTRVEPQDAAICRPIY